MKFEEKIQRIEEISDLLENDELTLDEMLKHYEEGIKLTKEAKLYLEKAELKLKKITETGISDFEEN